MLDYCECTGRILTGCSQSQNQSQDAYMCLIRRTRAVGKLLKVALESTALRNRLVPLEKPIGYCEE